MRSWMGAARARVMRFGAGAPVKQLIGAWCACLVRAGTEFQTRSGMSSKGCHDGVPCPGDIPKALPVPTGAEIQNAWLITNGSCAGLPCPPVAANFAPRCVMLLVR